ncbi:hypothetical protein [Nonomuraea sp. NPDC005650]|uniref:hypothetical protein n=1 Tax=Nonomuraea sp. NPDC005650 TaxID=3157045 RepID=UPI0033A5642D
MRLPAPPRLPRTNGRPPEHGGEFALADPATWPEAAVTTVTDTTHHRGHPDPAESRAPARRP